MSADLLSISLSVAVALWIEEVRDWSVERRLEAARECAPVIAAHGDDLQFGGKHAAETFNALARGLACLAYQPGGVTFNGDHWEAVSLMSEITLDTRLADIGWDDATDIGDDLIDSAIYGDDWGWDWSKVIRHDPDATVRDLRDALTPLAEKGE